MNNTRVHIFSLKSEICSLVKKTLLSEGYDITCSKAEEIDDNLIENFDMNIDCLILDKDINDELRNKIKEKFKGISIICLPSLTEETSSVKNAGGSSVTYMSEPFRLSELKKVIEEILHKEKSA